MATQPFGWEFIQSQEAADSATMDFLLPSGFGMFKLYCYSVDLVSDDVQMHLRTSTDAGVSFEAGGTDYEYAIKGVAHTDADLNTTQAGSIILTGDVASNAVASTPDSFNAEINIYNANQAGSRTRISCLSSFYASAGNVGINIAGGHRDSVEANDAIRLLATSGNMTTGTFALFGLKISGSA